MVALDNGKARSTRPDVVLTQKDDAVDATLEVRDQRIAQTGRLYFISTKKKVGTQILQTALDTADRLRETGHGDVFLRHDAHA